MSPLQGVRACVRAHVRAAVRLTGAELGRLDPEALDPHTYQTGLLAVGR